MRRSLISLLLLLLCCPVLWADDNREEINQLEAEMLHYFNTKERSAFIRVTNKLKDVCKKSGDERLYYKAWGCMSIYEAREQNYSQALDITQNILDDARENGSIYGEYAALHAEAMPIVAVTGTLFRVHSPSAPLPQVVPTYGY